MNHCLGCGDEVPVPVDVFGLPKLCGDCADEMRLIIDDLIWSVRVDELIQLARIIDLVRPTDDEAS